MTRRSFAWLVCAVTACQPVILADDRCYDEPPRVCACSNGQVGESTCDRGLRRYGACTCAAELDAGDAGDGGEADAGVSPAMCSEGWELVHAGSYTRGAPANEAGASAIDLPQHLTAISRAILVKTTEVTQREHLAVLGTNPSLFACDRCPVDNLGWHDALDYANALSELCGLPRCYPRDHDDRRGHVLDLDCTGFRLPTDAEWEYFARAGSSAAFHAELDRAGWYEANAEGRTHEVAAFAANAWGLYDVHGNVAEWVSDGFAYYSAASANDPLGPPWTGDADRVRRGGGFSSPAEGCRAAFRARSAEGAQVGAGVRLVRTAP
jgi:formylglycine-generating enzyme required for sulfatase activity